MQYNFTQRHDLSHLSRIRESQRRIPAMMIDESLVLDGSSLRRSSDTPQRNHLFDNVMTLDEADLRRVNRRYLREENVMILDEAGLGRVNRRNLRDEVLQDLSITRLQSLRLAEDLDLLKTRKYERSGESERCCVCQEDYAEGEKVAALTCGHMFHADCIARWLTQRNSCPVCKTTALSSL